VRGLGAADFRVGEVWAEGAGRRGGGATVREARLEKTSARGNEGVTTPEE
jgi:hypothetical protein